MEASSLLLFSNREGGRAHIFIENVQQKKYWGMEAEINTFFLALSQQLCSSTCSNVEKGCSKLHISNKVGFWQRFSREKDSVVLELIKLAAKQLHICYDHLVVWLQFQALGVMSFGQFPFTHGVMD